MALQRSEFGRVLVGRDSVVGVIEYSDVSPFPITAMEVVGTLRDGAAVFVMRNIDLTVERGNEIRFESRTNGTFRRELSRGEMGFWQYENVPEPGNLNRVKSKRGIGASFQVSRA